MDVPVGADTFYGPTPPPYQPDITRRPYVNNGPNDPGTGAQYEPRPKTGLGQEMTRPLYPTNGPVGHPDNAGTSGSKTFLNSAQPGTEQMYPPKGPAGQPKNGVPGAGNIEAVFPRGMSSVPLRKEPRVSGPRIKVVESLSPAEFSLLEKDANGVAGKKLGDGTFPPGMSLSNDLRVPIQTTPSPVNTFRKNVPNKIPLKRMVDPAQYLEKSKANLDQTGTSVSVNNRPNADPNYASGYTKPAEEPQSQIKHVVVSLAASSSSRLSSSPLRLRHNEKGEIIHPSTSGSNTQQKFLGNNAPKINTVQNQGLSKPIIRFSGLKTQTPRPSFRSRSVTVRAPLSRPGFKKAPLFRVRQTNTSSLPYRPRFLRRRGQTATENDRSSTMPASSAAQSPARVQSRVPTPQTAATSPKTHLPNYRPRSPVPRVGTNVGNQPPLPQTPTDSMREYRKTPNLNIKPEPQSRPSNQGIHAPSQDSPGYQQAQGTQSSYQSRLQNNQQQANTKPSVQTLGPQPPRKITFTLRRFSGGLNTKNNKPSVPQSSYNNPSLQNPQNPPSEINAYNSQSNPQTSNTYDNPQKTQQNVPSNIQQPSSYQQSQSLSKQQQQPSSYNKQAIASTPNQVMLPKPSQSSGYQTNNNPDPPQRSQNFNTQGQNVQPSNPAFQQAPGSVPQSNSWKPETGQGININMPAASLTSYQSGSGTSYQAPKHPTQPQKQQVGYQQQSQQQQKQQQQQGGYQHQSQQQMPGQQQLSHQPQQKQGYQKQSQQQQQHGGYQQQQQQNQESYQSKSLPTPQQNQHTGSNNGIGQPAFMQVNTNINNNARSGQMNGPDVHSASQPQRMGSAGNQGTGYGSAGGLVQTQNSQTNQARSMSQGALKEVVNIFNQQGQQLHGQVKPQGQTGATAYGQSANNQPGMQNQNSLATNTGATRSSGYSNTGSQGQGLAQSVNTQPSMQNQNPINSARSISYGGQQGQMPIQSSAGGSGQKLSQSLGQPNIGPNNQAGVSTSNHIQGQSQIAVKPGSSGQSGQGQGVNIQGTVQHGSQGQNPQTGIVSHLGGSPLNQGAINYPGLVGNSMSTQTNQGMPNSLRMQNGVNQGMQNGVNQGMQNGVNQGMQNGVNQGMQNGVNQGMQNGINQGMQNGVNQGMQNGVNQGMQNGVNQGMQNGINQGMQNGVNQGMQNGVNQGMQNGVNQGMQNGINQGMQNGVNQGMQNGVNQGMQNGVNQGMQNGVNQGMQNGVNQGMQNGVNQGMQNGVNQGMHNGVNQGIQNGAKQVQNGINQGVSGRTVQSITGGTQLNTARAGSLTAGGTLQGGVGTVGVGGQMNIGTQGGIVQNSMSATGAGGGMATGGTMTGPGRVRDLVLPYRNKGAGMLGAEPISFEVGVGGRMVMDPTDALRYKAQGGLLPINGMPGSQGANAQQVIHLEGQPAGNMFAQPVNGVAQRATAGNVGMIGTVRSQATVNLPSPPGTAVVAGQQNNQQQIITNQKPANQITFRGKRSTNTEFFSKYNLKPTRA
ncbi:probable serine/threonine-protein kinase yakA [Haliotis cracherodii]|uniref:probable serine/threonine-protein kinase yakA n=1 Tax=Haliotis cracherodii TaxID=6455 RepID=UPI0039EB9C13